MNSARSFLRFLPVLFILPWTAALAGTQERVSRTILVKYIPEASRDSSLAGITADLESLGLEVVHVFKPIRWIEARATGETQISDAILEKVVSLPSIEQAERDQVVHAIGEPNDPLWTQQTGMQRLNVATAWERTTGSADVVVAVSDSGVAWAHPDLADRIWNNPGEVPGNGVDDDGNGYIDDVKGWDFAEDDADPNDGNGHGTHVAGIIGAAGDNQEGVAGVNWNVRILPVRFLDASGSGSNANGVKTILYAADQGARVINMSWGGGGYSGALKDSIQYAHDKNMLAIAAAGNDTQNTDETPHYPSSYEAGTLISVASSQGDGKLSGFSNKGRVSVDLAAPGSSILSTYIPDTYKSLSGTSMASPMVAGVAALVLAEHPALEVTKLRNALLNAARPRDGYADKLATEGDLDAAWALNQFDSGFAVWPSVMTLGNGTSFRFSSHGGIQPVRWSSDASAVAEIDPASGLLKAKKLGSVTLRATDATGAVAMTARVSIVEAGKGGGGCNSLRGATPAEQAGSALPFALLLLAGLRRRKSRIES